MRRVERRAAPHFQAEEIRQPVRHGVGDRQHVVGAHARRQQRLVRVAERGVGDQQPLFFPRPLGEFLRAQLLQQLPRAWRRRSDRGVCGIARGFAHFRALASLHFRIAIDDHVAQIREQLGGAVARGSGSGTAPASRRETTW